MLDRPDPVTGAFVQGPVSDPGKENFNELLDGAGSSGYDDG